MLRVRACHAAVAGWYGRGEARARVLAYYLTLRQVGRDRPLGGGCRVRCRDCRIIFQTDRRNRGRRDLRCPFGCRRAHEKRAGSARSTAYYRTRSGRLKKKGLNARRRVVAPAPVATVVGPGTLDAEIVEHVRLLTCLVEGRRVLRAEVLEMLERVVRQHGLVRAWKGRDVLLRRPLEKPP